MPKRVKKDMEWLELLQRSHNLNGSELGQDKGYSVRIYMFSSIIYERKNEWIVH